MNAQTTPSQPRARYELRFLSLFHEGRGYAFPCDSNGQVDLNALSDNARRHYLAARTSVGRDLATPAVRLHTVQ
jgi:hypothetical protein